jgi:hypothetical protein
MQLTQLNKIDLDNKEMQYNKDIENQRNIYVEDQSNLKKRLQERV